MKRFNSTEREKEREGEREEKRREEKRREEKRREEKRQNLMIDDRSNHLQSLIMLCVCLFAICSYLCSKTYIDCRYLLEPRFQVRTIYVLRKIPK